MGTEKLDQRSPDPTLPSRRQFLKGTAGVIGLASFGGLLQACATPGASSSAASVAPPASASAAATAAASAAASASGAALEGPVNWLTSTPALADPAAIGAFEAATGIKIAAVPYGTYDEMLTKVRGGQTPFDIVNMDQSHAKILADEGHILPIPVDQMPSFAKVYPVFRDRATINFNGETWAAPQFFGANALAYNKKFLPQVDSIEALFDQKNSGKIGMPGYAEDGLIVGARKLGFKPYEMDDAQLAQVKQVLIDQKPLVRVYWKGIADLQTAFANEEIHVGFSQLLLIQPLKDAGLDMGWTWPKEGVSAFLAVVGMAKTATHKPAAAAFLNYLMSPEWGLPIAAKYGYAPCSEASFDAMTPEVRQKVNIDPTRIGGLEFRQAYDREKWNKIWEEVMAA